MASGFDDFINAFSSSFNKKGILEPLITQQEQENKNKLELAMLSKRLEMEQKAKQLPIDQVMASFGALGATPQQAGQFEQFSSVNPDIYTQTATGLRQAQTAQIKAQDRLNRQRSPQIRTIGNEVVSLRWDPQTQTYERQSLGIAPQFQKAAADTIGNFSASDSILDEIKNFSEAFNVSGNILQTLPQGIKTRLSAFAVDNPMAKAYLDTRENFALQLTALVSGKQMTEEERRVILKALPGPEDSLESARLKIEHGFSRPYEETKKRKVEAYIGKQPEASRQKIESKQNPINLTGDKAKRLQELRDKQAKGALK